VRPFGLVLCLAWLLLASPALAATTTTPQGNSGITEYSEDVPTENGSAPTAGIGGGGDGGGGPTGGSGGAVSDSVRQRLEAQGGDGAALARAAEATAPRAGGAAAAGGGQDGSTGSALGSILSSSPGGMGVVFPILLVGTLIGALALAVVRARRRRA
jgi:hypothetical protein